MPDLTSETNLGMPLIYLIWRLWSKRFNEDLSRPKSAEDEAQGNDEKIPCDVEG